jgi:lipopolysaccharide biosynthesis glycosyltransferase
VVLDGEVLFLDGRWNTMAPGVEPAVLRHFADFQKPWKEAYDPQQADAYRRVYRESPWGDVPLDPPGRRSEKKFMSRRRLGEGRWLEAAGWYLRYAFTSRR